VKTFLVAFCLLLAGCTVLTDTSFSAEGGASPVFLTPWADADADAGAADVHEDAARDAGSDVAPVDASVPDVPLDVPLDVGNDVVLVDADVPDVPLDVVADVARDVVTVDASVPDVPDAPIDVPLDTTLDAGDDTDAFVNPLDCECPEGYRRCSGSHLCARSWCCIPQAEFCGEYTPQPRCQEFYD